VDTDEPTLVGAPFESRVAGLATYGHYSGFTLFGM